MIIFANKLDNFAKLQDSGLNFVDPAKNRMIYYRQVPTLPEHLVIGRKRVSTKINLQYGRGTL